MKNLIILLLLQAGVISGRGQTIAQVDTAKKLTTIGLDSIVVFNNGYQSIPRSRATGSFTHVNNNTLNLQVGSNILERLESVAAGVAIAKKAGGMPPITVRGLSTINGPTSPLIILDNFPYEGDINAINPNMIESITILKDATAASIWGTRAGNGVIVINTKKGKYYQPFSIDFNSTIQVVDRPQLSALRTISPSDYVDLEQMLFSKGYYNNQLISSAHPVVSPVVDLLDQQARGLISQAEANAKILLFKNSDVKNILNDNYYSSALNQQYAITFSGGNSKSAWLVSGGYDHNLSGLAEKMERRSARFENSFTPVKNLKLSGSLLVTGTVTKTGKDEYGTQDYLYPYSSLFNQDGSPVPFARAYRSSYTDTLWAGKLLDWGYFPTEDYKQRHTAVKSGSLIFNAGAQYELSKGFSIEAKYQTEMQHQQTRTLSGAESYNARYFVNLYSQVNAATGVVTYNIPQGGILDILNNDIKASNYRVQANYSGKWGKHRLSGLAGSELREIRNTGESYRTYGYNADLATGSIVDFKTRFPIITTGDLLTIPGGENLFTDQLKRYVSFFGNAAYNFDNKYTFTLSARRDASNLFGVNTNQKWTPLWSSGVGWQVSNAAFYKSDIFPFLKLRATYGYTGNADPSRSGVVTVFANGNSSLTGLTTYRIRQFPNPQLRWEQVAITNLGIDFGTKNNRLSGSIEFYTKKGVDLFANSIMDLTTGISGTGITRNVANMKGKGIDMAINSVNTTSGLKWSTSFLFSHNTDYVTETFIASPSGIYYVSDGSSYGALKGKPVHSVLSLRWGGLEASTGNPQGYLNGKLSTDYTALTSTSLTLDDLEYSGPALPQFFGSLANEFTWKNLGLNINISYKFKYFFKRKPLNYSALFFNDRLSTADYANRWKNAGDETFTDIPSLIYPLAANRDNFYTQSAAVVEKGDHIRLQFINFYYRFTLKNKGSAQNGWKMQCFANASNIGIIWRANKHRLDPDYAVNAVPPSKGFALGLKLFFQ